MLWFDTIIFVLTFYKAIKLRHEMPGGLLVTMFRDGTLALCDQEASRSRPVRCRHCLLCVSAGPASL